VLNVKTLNGSEHDGRDLLNDDMDFMLSQVAENISFFFFIEIENFRGLVCEDKLITGTPSISLSAHTRN
jgi:hypothetical protein